MIWNWEKRKIPGFFLSVLDLSGLHSKTLWVTHRSSVLETFLPWNKSFSAAREPPSISIFNEHIPSNLTHLRRESLQQSWSIRPRKRGTAQIHRSPLAEEGWAPVERIHLVVAVGKGDPVLVVPRRAGREELLEEVGKDAGPAKGIDASLRRTSRDELD